MRKLVAALALALCLLLPAGHAAAAPTNTATPSCTGLTISTGNYLLSMTAVVVDGRIVLANGVGFLGYRKVIPWGPGPHEWHYFVRTPKPVLAAYGHFNGCT